MGRTVLNFTEGNIQVGYYKGLSNRKKTYKKYDFKLNDTFNLNSEVNVNEFKDFLKNRFISVKTCDIILSVDGIITRLVEIPNMKPRELKEFLKNNIDDYFTLNKNEYFFDYKVSRADDKKVNVFLSAIPKVKMNNILSFAKSLNIKIKCIKIYPDVISNIFSNDKVSIGVIDIDNEKTYVTIIEKNNIFLYSILNSELTDKEDIVEYVDNINYFLNFYATRHFGNRIDNVYILGEINEETKNLIEEHIGIKVNRDIEFEGRRINKDLLFYGSDKEKIFKGKSIDFNKSIKEKSKYSFIAIPMIVLTFITAAWFILTINIINAKIKKYDSSELDRRIKNYVYIDNKLKEIEEKKKVFENRQNFLKTINNDKFDYIKILNIITKGIPMNIGIKSISIDKIEVNGSFKIKNKKTIDIAKLIIALNKMNIFEPVDAELVKLDDKMEEIDFTLKLKTMK